MIISVKSLVCIQCHSEFNVSSGVPRMILLPITHVFLTLWGTKKHNAKCHRGRRQCRLRVRTKLGWYHGMAGPNITSE